MKVKHLRKLLLASDVNDEMEVVINSTDNIGFENFSSVNKCEIMGITFTKDKQGNKLDKPITKEFFCLSKGAECFSITFR